MTKFSAEQIDRLSGPESHAELARAFGMSDMPIRRWRTKNRWERSVYSPVPQPAEQNTISEQELLKAEIADLKKALRKGSRTDVGDERVLRAIEQAIERVEPVALPPYVAPRLSTGSANPHHRHVAMWSDWHYGEHVDAESVNDLNAYGVAICEDRVAQLVKSILSFKRVRPEMTGLDIWALGDMATGKIHDLEETNEVPAQEQYVAVGYLMASAIQQLAPHYPEIVVYGTWGNHPRDKPTPSTSHSNGDWVAYQLAAAATKHLPNVRWVIPKAGMVVAPIAGRKALLWHGDGIRSNSAGVPWMAMMKRASGLRETFAEADVKIDYLAVGHYHQESAVPGLFMNGSLIGSNTHGLKNYGGGRRPCQLLLTFDEAKRRLVDTAYCTPS